ncbi:hypothetical protein IV203_036267 [Nitzschia inconspicua]|uniref:Uncharacterized protein n=1 Tax=Nitzschia inconspicua TaxID=303405 RepID=A0A9K3PVB4_9STRA|nr:hypothetical protein IV203_036267 [Nitzschia inconspicua]
MKRRSRSSVGATFGSTGFSSCTAVGMVTIGSLFVFLVFSVAVGAFLPTSRRISEVKVPSAKTYYGASLPTILQSTNPFFADISDKVSSPKETTPKKNQEETQPSPTPPSSSPAFDPNPDALISRARVVFATDFGIQDPSILAEDFLWIRPLAETPLGKIDYLAAGKFFDLRSTFPDLDYRAHDFRIDAQNPLTVRCTSRPVGTMRGSLRLRNEVVEANGKILRGPPEAISMTFDQQTGKLQKLCSEFVMDRQVGNTNGLSGVKAAATVAGVPPSDWEVYPVSTVVSRFFGRPMEPIKEPTTFLAPFPETVMISLAKGVLFAKLGAQDPSLLAKEFAFVTPTIGPIGKTRFLESYAAEQFGDFEADYQFSNYRVDPYDPYRVWVDVKLLGSGLEGPPQAWSFTFDDDGFCTRITGGAVMDPSIGNTGGLPGMEGIQYALGEGSPDIATRPLPLALGRIKKTIISPITKIEADAFVLDKAEKADIVAPVPKEDATAARKRILDQAKARIERAENAKREAREKVLAARAKAALPIPPSPPPPRVPKPPKVEPPQLDANETNLPNIEMPKIELQTFKLDLPTIDIPRPSLEIPKFGASQTAAKGSTRPAKEVNRTAETSTADKMEVLRKKQQEAKERMAAEAERKREAAEEARQKRQKLEEQSRAQAEAKRKQEEQRIAIAKKNADERRRKVEEQRQAQIAARKKQEEQTKAAAKAKIQNETQSRKQTAPRPSFQLPRPSISIPKPLASPPEAVTGPPKVQKRPSFSLPRPSLTIPKPAETKTSPSSKKTENRPSLSLPRPSFQLLTPASPTPPKVVSSDSKSVTKRPSFALFQSAKLKEAPKGVPTVVGWRVRSDGGIAGRVFGSVNFREGQQFETSPIVKGEIENGSVVQTASGSRYFLSDKSAQQMKQQATNFSMPPKELNNVPRRATIQLTKKSQQIEMKRALKATKKAPPGATISLSSIFGLGDKDETKTGQQIKSASMPTKAPAKPSPAGVKSSATNSSPTISLGSFFNAGNSGSSMKSPPKASTPIKKEAPKGVPTIERWKVGRDKAVTGFIRGSNQFRDGEKVTTSPISKGILKSGEMVVTSSGTRYFLK